PSSIRQPGGPWKGPHHLLLAAPVCGILECGPLGTLGTHVPAWVHGALAQEFRRSCSLRWMAVALARPLGSPAPRHASGHRRPCRRRSVATHGATEGRAEGERHGRARGGGDAAATRDGRG